MLPIILNIADDEDRAFVEKLYIKYEKHFYLIAKKYLKDHHDAEDCVHDTVSLIIKSVEKFKHAQNGGYLDKLATVVCRNCAINALRVKTRKLEYEQSTMKFNYEEEEYEEIDIPDEKSAVDKLYVSEQNCNRLRALIDKLDQKYRDVILLKSLGFDNRGIADIMGITEVLVRKRYSRARKLLLKMGGEELYAE